jgi:hypothetical protein
MRNLSPNMERYCCSRANGMTQKAAYRASYACAKSSDNTVSREASLLEADPKIAQRIKEIRNEAAKGIMWEIQDAARPLLEVLEQARPVFARKAANDEIDNGARLAITESIRILNELFGMDGTQSVDTDGGVTIVDDIGD